MRSSSSRRFRRRFRARLSSLSTRTPRMWSRETSSALPALAVLSPASPTGCRYYLCEYYLGMLELKVIDGDRKAHCLKAKVASTLAARVTHPLRSTT